MSSSKAFDTEVFLSGPLRTPRQMLAEQEYGGHLSIHDDETANELGFSGAPIEGPTHFSQFVPLLTAVWGDDFLARGAISSHYQNPCVEGDQVRAFVEQPTSGDVRCLQIRAEKADGTPVLTGTATLGPDHPESELDRRINRLRPPERLLILEDVRVGMKSEKPDQVVMDFSQNMGALYPFTLNQKLDKITEPSPYYTAEGAAASPWGRPIVPFEMISVLLQYSNFMGYPVKGPAVGLFADQEIKLFNGPLFVGQPYNVEREVVALSESRRTESLWERTYVTDLSSGEPVAEMLLNHASLKDSYAGYQKG